MSPSILSAIWLFAQDGGGGAAPPGQGPPPGSMLSLLAPFVLIFILFYFLMIRPEKRKTAEHKSLLDTLKKNDRVVTIGGIYGVVANVQRDADRVSIKVDETNNTKLDVTFSSIARVIAEQSADEKK